MLRRPLLRGLGSFTLIWSGEVISALGSGLTNFAIGVRVFQETESVTRFALIGVAHTLPLLLFSPLAGFLADRFERRLLLIVCNLGSALVYLALYGLIVSGRLELWHVYGMVALNSFFTTFVWPTLSAATTLIVGKSQLARASGMNQMGISITHIAAPLLAGALLEQIDLAGIVLLDVASFLVAASILLGVLFPQPEASAAGLTAPKTVREQTAHSWRFIRQRPGLLELLLVFIVVNFVFSMVITLLTPLVLSFASPVVLGLVMSTASAGTLVGGILMNVWGGPQRRVAGILAALAVCGIFAMIGSLRASVTLIASAAFFLMMGLPVLGALSQAIWQTKVPPDLQGRVFALRRMIVSLAAPLGIGLAGPLTDQVSEPLMVAGGPLAASAGRLLGVGPGRGVALLIMLLGVVMMTTAAIARRAAKLRRLEEDVPDAVADEPDAVLARPASMLGALGRAPVVASTTALLLCAVATLAFSSTPDTPAGQKLSQVRVARLMASFGTGFEDTPPHPRPSAVAMSAGEVAFEVPGGWTVVYPARYGHPLVALTGLGLAVVLGLGLRRGRLTAFGIWQGLLALLGATVASSVAFSLVVFLLDALRSAAGGSSSPMRIVAALTLLALAAMSGLYLFLRTFMGGLDLLAGALLWWWLLAVAASGLLLPLDSHYLFVWPLAFALGGLGYLCLVADATRRPWLTVAVLTLAALPGVLLVMPLTALLDPARLGGIALAPLVLLLGLISPHLEIWTRRRPWLPMVAGLAGLVLLGSTTF